MLSASPHHQPGRDLVYKNTDGRRREDRLCTPSSVLRTEYNKYYLQAGRSKRRNCRHASCIVLSVSDLFSDYTPGLCYRPPRPPPKPSDPATATTIEYVYCSSYSNCTPWPSFIYTPSCLRTLTRMIKYKYARIHHEAVLRSDWRRCQLMVGGP